MGSKFAPGYPIMYHRDGRHFFHGARFKQISSAPKNEIVRGNYPEHTHCQRNASLDAKKILTIFLKQYFANTVVASKIRADQESHYLQTVKTSKLCEPRFKESPKSIFM